ncbi:MAG: efflux transporter outer membrane subunit [Nitrospinae bacterium]|nr:efflux transporter outer membrane subunit [Nitrospinota bacterium]
MLTRGARTSAAITLLAAPLWACAILPPERGPDALMNDPATLSQPAVALASPRHPGEFWPRAEWWKEFGDTQLEGLIERAISTAPDANAAAARVALALRRAELAGAERSPSLDASADVTRQRISENGLIPAQFVENPFTLSQTLARISFDLDLWGKNRALARAASGEARAAEAERQLVRHTVALAVASAYVELKMAIDLDLRAATLARHAEEAARLARVMTRVGVADRRSIAAAEARMAVAGQQRLLAARRVESARHRIAALMGEGPAAGYAITPSNHLNLTAPGAPPDDLPLELVRRRADIQAALWRIESAGERIHVAEAGFYPSVNLAAMAGLQSLELETLFEGANTMYTIGPSVRLPLFEGGRLKANLGARHAERDLAVEAYNKVLIEAAKEVADALSGARALEAVYSLSRRDAELARDAGEVTLARARRGVEAPLAAVNARMALIGAEARRAAAEGERDQARLALIRALGGGYVAQERQ